MIQTSKTCSELKSSRVQEFKESLSFRRGIRRGIFALLLLCMCSTAAWGNSYSAKVTATSTPTGYGTAYVDGQSENTRTGQSAGGNQTFALTATPSSDIYAFKVWEFTSGSGTFANANSASTNVTVATSNTDGGTSNYTVRATFAEKPLFYYTASAGVCTNGNHGTASASPTSGSGRGTSWNSTSASANITYTAMPDEWYKFDGWYTNQNGTGSAGNSNPNVYNQSFNSKSENSPTELHLYAKFSEYDKSPGHHGGGETFNFGTVGNVISSPDDQHFFGGSSTADHEFTPSTDIWAGTSGRTWRNNAGYYINITNGNPLTLGLNSSSGSNLTANGNRISYRYNNNDHYIRYDGGWKIGASGGYDNVLYSATKSVRNSQWTVPEFTTPGTLSALSTTAGTCNITTDASFTPGYVDYIFNNKDHYFKRDESARLNNLNPEQITYTWSLVDFDSKYATIDNNGVINFKKFPPTQTTVQVRLTATSESNTFVVEHPVTFIGANNPTNISATTPITIFTGEDYDLPYTLTPGDAYDHVVATSSNTSAFTASSPNEDGKVTLHGVANGSGTLTLQAMEGDDETVARQTTVSVTVKTHCAKPTISFNSQTGMVTIATTTPGAAIHYTLDDSDPTSSSETYSTPFQLTEGATVKAIATKAGIDDSEIGVLVVEQTATPQFTITDDERIEITCSTPGAVIYYTTDGTDPTSSSTEYTNVFAVDKGTVVKAIAITPNHLNSAIGEITYSVALPTPEISFEPSDAGSKAVTTITCSQDGSTIYYTVNGANPDQNATHYTGPFEVNQNDVVRAIAYHESFNNSKVATAKCSLHKLPLPSIDINGNEVTFSCDEDVTTYYYTTDGSTPTKNNGTAWTPGSAPITTIADGAIIKVIATRSKCFNSDVASRPFYKASGISGTVVTLNDLEDHNWTYYKGVDTNVDGGNYNTNYAGKMYSPNPRNVKITYNGVDTSGQLGTAVAVSKTESQNQFIYYKTLEEGSTAGEYPYQVISSPFSKRPKVNGTYYGFAGWKIISGGEYIKNHSNNDVLSLDENIVFNNLPYPSVNCTSAEIVLQATWTAATVKTGTTAQSFTGGTYETNFWVIIGNVSGISDYASNATITMMTPDGGATNDYTTTASLSGDISISKTSNATTKIEWLRMNTNGSVNAAGRNLTIGRGVTNISNGGAVYGLNSNNTNVNQIFKIESGKFTTFTNYANNPSSITKQWITFGCDYDRAASNNNKLTFSGVFNVGSSLNLGLLSSGEMCRVYSKSGSFMTGISISDASADNSYYFSIQNTHNDGHRYLEIEGGDWYANIAGGMGQNHTTTLPAFTFRMKGGKIRGSVYGAAAFANAGGLRTYVLTGGTIGGWLAGGANGTQNTNGKTDGKTFIYVGGNSSIDSNGSTSVINRAVGGNVFGAGCGYNASSTSGQITYGTNVVVADNAYIERGLYGGGSYGYCSTDQTSYIYVTGGHVGGVNGGVNGTNYSSSITGGVFGGACQNKGGAVKIYMTGGLVEGGLYGGSNSTGTLSLSTELHINGGQVGTTSKIANIHGGGYGANTDVSQNVDITLGYSDQEAGTGVTTFGDVYGGSALGRVNTNANNHTNVTMNAGTINGSIYGGALGAAGTAANVNGKVAVNVYGGSVKKTTVDGSGGVYGANNINGAPQNQVTVDIYGTDPAPANDQYALYAVYGGGNKANYTYGNGYPKVTVHGCDNSIEYVYGGGNAAAVAATDVTVWGGNIIGNVFGGGNGTVSAANVTGNATTKIYGGTILNVFGGSNSNGTIGGTISVTVDSQGEGGDTPCPMQIGNVYGGGNEAASQVGNINIVCTGENGKIETVYGGANAANITGNIALNISGGNIGTVYGGNNASGTISGSVGVTIDKDDNDCGVFRIGTVFGGGNEADMNNTANVVTVQVLGTEAEIGNIYGGGNLASVYSTSVTVKGGNISGNVYGGGKGTIGSDKEMIKSGGTKVHIYGGTIRNVFGGNDAGGTITGDIEVEIDKTQGDDSGHLVISGDVYGGGNQAASDAGSIDIVCANTIANVYGGARDADVNGDITLNVGSGQIGRVFGGNNIGGVVSGTITVNIEKVAGDCGNDFTVGEVYGAGNKAEYSATEGPIVNIKSGTVTTNVFGGGLGESAKVTGNPEVHIIGGSIGDGDPAHGNVFGGGDAAPVDGSTTVTAIAGEKPAIINITNVYGGGKGETASVSGGTTVVLNGTHISGNVFGGGDRATTGEDTSITIGDTGTENTHSATVIDGAVYGGGNLANVGTVEVNEETGELSTNGGITTVDIYECETKIGKIEGDKYNGGVFGGGNAAEVNGTNINVRGCSPISKLFGGGNGEDLSLNLDGAKINGNVVVNITGGEIGQVFGGSNNKGQISGTVEVNVETVNDECPTEISELYGGGNKAPGAAGTLTIGCGTDLQDVYGGAKQADVTSDITLNVTGGKYINVFGGNNLGGRVLGKITVNINNTDNCDLNIDNVFGGGNQAKYDPVQDIANYNREHNGEAGFIPIDASTRLTGYYPEVNIIKGKVNFNVYGGGYLASVTGRPQVNINAGKNLTEEEIQEHGINDADVWVQNIYGGGAKADIVGNTIVNVYHGTITGDIFGGGEGVFNGNDEKNDDNYTFANVDGSTNVYINGGTINFDDATFSNTHNIYGGGNIACRVSGNSTVRIWKTMLGEKMFDGVSKPDGDGAQTFREQWINFVDDTTNPQFSVFGGGYGAKTHVAGNTYVTLEPEYSTPSALNSAAAWNINYYGLANLCQRAVFGGGLSGTVGGKTNVTLTRNAWARRVYGGGMLADVGTERTDFTTLGEGDVEEEDPTATVTITGGMVQQLYGGGFEGDIKGSTLVSIPKIEEGTSYITLVEDNIYGGGYQGKVSRNTEVEIADGYYGNSIFGGGQGFLGDENRDPISADIAGETQVDVTGGSFFYIDSKSRVSNKIRLYGVFAGGKDVCDVDGTAHLNMTRGMYDEDFISKAGFATMKDSKPWDRRYTMCGGGYGRLTTVRSADVDINLSKAQFPALDSLAMNRLTGAATAPNQTFMDIVGGGCEGSVKEKVEVDIYGRPYIRNVYGGSLAGNVQTDLDYLRYENGDFYLRYENGWMTESPLAKRANDNTCFEKFYSQVNLHSGMIWNAYGGAFMGDCLGQVYLNIGEKDDNDDSNDELAIYEVYGGNDISGVIGRHRIKHIDSDQTTFEPRGVHLNIYGGRILDVYGAGNGNYPFYQSYDYYTKVASGQADYIPANWDRSIDPRKWDEADLRKTYQGKSRPITFNTNINIQGTAAHPIRLFGRLFGGGNSCSIGYFNSSESNPYAYEYTPISSTWTNTLGNYYPRYYYDESGQGNGYGFYSVNIGSYVTINELYMGNNGEYLYDESQIPLNKFTTENGTDWFPGFSNNMKPTPDLPIAKNDFDSYFNAIQIIATPSITFNTDETNTLPEVDEHGNVKPESEGNGKADAQNVYIGSFYGGGNMGSIGCNNPYSFTLTRGVTVTDKVVLGSNNAYLHFVQPTGTPNVNHEFTRYAGVKPTKAKNILGEGNPNELITQPDGTRITFADAITNQYKESWVTLNLNCQFSPIAAATIQTANGPMAGYKGVSIYGGCYARGVVYGSTTINLNNSLTGWAPNWDLNVRRAEYNNMNFPSFVQDIALKSAMLHTPVGQIFGAGYGANTMNLGDTHVQVNGGRNGDVCVMNAFGGGYQGTVVGNTRVDFNGGKNGYIYIGAYGGGYLGDVRGGSNDDRLNYMKGLDPRQNKGSETYNLGLYGPVAAFGEGEQLIANRIKGEFNSFLKDNDINVRDSLKYMDISMLGNTNVYVNSGSIQFGYGGALNANIAGGTTLRVGHKGQHEEDNEHNIIMTYAYGGNDIGGLVTGQQRHINSEGEFKTSAYISVEKCEGNDTKQKGINNNFPLVFQLFGGGNGDYDYENVYQGVTKPNLKSTYLDLLGGTIWSAFGGGNNVTITDNCQIHFHQEEMDSIGANIPYDYGEFGGHDSYNMAKYFFQKLIVGTDVYYEEGTGLGCRKPTSRLYGGNNLADSDIHPTWHLHGGHVGSLYMGGNMGRMTYYDPAKDVDPDFDDPGLSLDITSDSMYVDNLYAGCRMANVAATLDDEATEKAASIGLSVTTYASQQQADAMTKEGSKTVYKQNLSNTGERDVCVFLDYQFGAKWHENYGSVLNIHAGHYGNIYGGCDVSGNIYNGSHINITGGIIHGDVYTAGNGNYYYQVDNTVSRITEEQFAPGSNQSLFHVPTAGFGYSNPMSNPTERMLLINDNRPNNGKARLDINGSNKNIPVYILGAVYCGGNSATMKQLNADVSFIASNMNKRFNIGKNAVINNVFLGSNGANLANNEMALVIADKNNFTYSTVVSPEDRSNYHLDEGTTILDLYMAAVEATSLPCTLYELTEEQKTAGTVPYAHFNFNAEMQEDIFIGGFYVGGNKGSLFTTETEATSQDVLQLDFPRGITIFKRIVGGCNDTNFKDPQGSETLHIGGLGFKNLSTGQILPDKTLKLDVSSKFWNRNLIYDEERMSGTECLEANTDNRGVFNAGGNIYGGCFNSGITWGNVDIDLHSDMIEEGRDGNHFRTGLGEAIDNPNKNVFEIYGGGYGANTIVKGNTHIRLIPKVVTIHGKELPNNGDEGDDIWASAKDDLGSADEELTTTQALITPAASNVFGGASYGTIEGNSLVEIRAGEILRSVYGGCVQGTLKGSTQVIVGYPDYYRVKEGKTARFHLSRGDSRYDNRRIETYDEYGSDKLRKCVQDTVVYKAGDLIPVNVWKQIDGVVSSTTSETEYGNRYGTSSPLYTTIFADADAKNAYFDCINYTDDESAIYTQIYNQELTEEKSIWHNITIHEAIYGGGREGNNAGAYTVVKSENPVSVGGENLYTGGNASIMVCDYRVGDENGGDEYITISDSTYTYADVKDGSDVWGKFKYDAEHNCFDLQPSGSVAETNAKYFTLTGNGGIFGDGHYVFCEGFRACDLSNYGYNSSTPYYPKSLNCFQRLDLLTTRDCCLQMQGTSDFATPDQALSKQLFSMARIGEFRMESTIDSERDYVDSHNILVKDFDKPDFTKKRVRNYIRFYTNIHFLGSIISDEAFAGPNSHYHGTDGKVVTEGSNNQYDTFKQSKIQSYYKDEAGTGTATTDNYTVKYPTNIDGKDATDSVQAKAIKDISNTYKSRNDGAAKNVIGINNGYTLEIKNAFFTKNENQLIKNTYYGPIIGVCETHLLSSVVGEGGGYIYADNAHKDVKDTIDNVSPENGHVAYDDFLEQGGNFVFAGTVVSHIVDDCFSHGYNYRTGSPLTTGTGPSSYTRGQDHPADDCHYWYIEGHIYNYQAYITGYTSRDEKNFYMENESQLVSLSQSNTGDMVVLESAKWLSFNNKDENGYMTDYIRPSDCNNFGENHRTMANYNDYITKRTWGQDEKAHYYSDLQDDYLMSDNKTQGGYTLDFWLNSDGNNIPYTNAFYGIVPRDIAGQDTHNWNYTEDGKGSYGANYTYNVNNNDITAEKTYPLINIIPQDVNNISLNDPVMNIRLTDRVNNVDSVYRRHHLAQEEIVELRLANVKSIPQSEQYAALNISSIVTDNKNHTITITYTDASVETCKLLQVGENDWKYAAYTYVVRLHINYIQGPDVSGKLTYRNCALPGEKLSIGLDSLYFNFDQEATPIRSKRYVFLPKNEKYDATHEQQGLANAIEIDDVTEIKDDEDHIDFLAKYLHNNYKPYYIVQILGFPDAYVFKTDGDDELTSHFTVHNYHKMSYLWQNITSDADLDVIPGSIIYIEDQADWEAFKNYFQFCNKQGNGSSYYNTNEYYKSSDPYSAKIRNIHPLYCEGLNFRLMCDIEDNQLPTAPTNMFKGSFDGNGHTIKNTATDYSNHHYLFGQSEGKIYNLGLVNCFLVSQHSADQNVEQNQEPEKNTFNCFVYGTDEFVNAHKNCTDHIIFCRHSRNCYQNVNNKPGEVWGNANTFATNDKFNYGRLAFDLNEWYLAKRFIKYKHQDHVANPSSASFPDITRAEYDKYKELDGHHIDYFTSSDYRYAKQRSELYPEFLRTATTPNYGSVVSAHDATHPIDETRLGYIDENGYEGHWADAEHGTGEFTYYTKNDANVKAVSLPVADDDLRLTPEQYAQITVDDERLKNDFLMFQQDLQATPEKYPSALESFCTRDISHRVWRTFGFYGDRDDDCFYFNSNPRNNTKCYVHDPKLTAIDFAGLHEYFPKYWWHTYAMGWDAGQHDNQNPANEPHSKSIFYPYVMSITPVLNGFEVDDAVSKNLIVYTPNYDLTNTAGITQTYMNEVQNTLAYTATTPESQIKGHQVIVMIDSTSYGGGSNVEPYSFTKILHLVDRIPGDESFKNDFNVPNNFYVEDSVWYYRKPLQYSNTGNQGWDGIVLPFWANKVSAGLVNGSQYVETFSPVNGEISHFYGSILGHNGNHEFRHEYWLRGLTGINTNKAKFQRPGQGDVTSVYDAGSIVKDYTYTNTVFNTIYNNNLGEGNEDRYMARADEYKEARTFTGYYFLTQHKPYIVSYPGEKFYEFDLSGEFNKRLAQKYTGYSDLNTTPQTIRYAYIAPDREHAQPISVTDESTMTTTVGGYSHIGTMKAIDNDGLFTMNEDGTKFEYNDGAQEIKEVAPFRTYMTTAPSSAKPEFNGTRSIWIMGEDDVEDFKDEGKEIGEETIDPTHSMKIFIKDHKIVIESTYAADVNVYYITGQFVKRLHVEQGRNTYGGFRPGFYIVNTTKLYMPQW